MNKKKNTQSNYSLFSYYGFIGSEAKKYPVVTNILKELTFKKIKETNNEVEKIKIPPLLNSFLQEYSKIGASYRTLYLWKWIFRGIKIFTSRKIPEKLRKNLLETKFLFFVLDTFIDDICDNPRFRNQKLLEESLRILEEKENYKITELSFKNRKKINFIKRIWQEIKKRVKLFPFYQNYQELLKFDILQITNMFRYSYLLNSYPFLLNQTENFLYFPSVMQARLHFTLELMCLTNFNLEELGKIRMIGWKVERMARIGNAITTWKREITDKDFTSDIFALALKKNIFNISELTTFSKEKIIRIIRQAKIEKELLKKWEEIFSQVLEISSTIKTFPVDHLPSVLKKILIFHLTSRGYK